MTEPKFELKKVSNDKYQFITTTDKFERVETVSKEVLKEEYHNALNQYSKYSEDLKRANKDIEINQVEKDDELERFIKLADKAAGYNKYMKAIAVRDNVLDFLKRIEKQKHDIEAVCPEFKRGKK